MATMGQSRKKSEFLAPWYFRENALENLSADFQKIKPYEGWEPFTVEQREQICDIMSVMVGESLKLDPLELDGVAVAEYFDEVQGMNTTDT